MERSEIIQAIERSRVIVIPRHGCEGFIEEHLPMLISAGLTAIEVSSTADNYETCLSKLPVKQYGDQLAIGAGTIFSTQQAQHALDSAARFLISPHLDEALAQFIIAKDVP